MRAIAAWWNLHDATPRLFHPIVGVMSLGVVAFVSTAPRAETEADDGPDWPCKLTGRHKQVVDVYALNDAAPIRLRAQLPHPEQIGDGSCHPSPRCLPLALNHAMWAKYKIGEAEKINDPETKAAAVKNPYFEAKLGVLRNDNAAIEKLLARFGACEVALRGHARRLPRTPA